MDRDETETMSLCDKLEFGASTYAVVVAIVRNDHCVIKTNKQTKKKPKKRGQMLRLWDELSTFWRANPWQKIL